MTCNKCGARNYPDAKYCSRCGQKLSRKKNRVDLILAAVCLLVIGIGLGILIPRIGVLGGRNGNGPEKPALNAAQVEQTQNSDPEEGIGSNASQSGSDQPNLFVGMFHNYQPDANYIASVRNKYPRDLERYSSTAFLPYVNEILTLYLADLEDAGFDFDVIERVDMCSESSYVVELTENGESEIQVAFTISAYDPKAATIVTLGCNNDSYRELDRLNRNLEAMWIAYNKTLNIHMEDRGIVDLILDGERSVSDQYGVMLRGQYDGLGYVQATGDQAVYLSITPDLSLSFFDGMDQIDGSEQEGSVQKGSSDWKENLLEENPLDIMTEHREKIVCVVFLDTLEDAPEKPWNLGQSEVSEQVQGWIQWEDGWGYAYIAAEGGINGRDACDGLFAECDSLHEVRFNGAFHTDETKSMANMFYKCYTLEEVDLETLNTSNVITMYQMFRECGSLERLDLSRLDTANVETMYGMFSTCPSLKTLDLRSFDTSKVTNMGYMFSACSKLEKVDVSSFDTSRVYNMEGMFRWCNELKEYDFSSWDVSGVEKYSGFMNSGMQIGGQKWENFFQ